MAYKAVPIVLTMTLLLFDYGLIYYLAQILPFVLEFFLFSGAFPSLYEEATLKVKVPNSTTLLLAMIANLTSIASGLVIFSVICVPYP